jgi:hypothetical protein
MARPVASHPANCDCLCSYGGKFPDESFAIPHATGGFSRKKAVRKPRKTVKQGRQPRREQAFQ